MKYSYILTEGPHDLEFVAKFIKKTLNLSRIQYLSQLDSFWNALIPTTFPFDAVNSGDSDSESGDILKRAPIPVFFQNEVYSVAIHAAGSITKLVNTLEESLAVLDWLELDSIALICDADDNSSKNFENLCTSAKEKIPSLELPEQPGEVFDKNQATWVLGEGELGVSTDLGTKHPRVGIYVLPDNVNNGTLEDILVKCGEKVHSDLFNQAKAFVKNVDFEQLKSKEKQEIKKPAGEKKAILSSMASIFKPGKAFQVSIQDNKWISEDSQDIVEIMQFQGFVNKLFGVNGTVVSQESA